MAHVARLPSRAPGQARPESASSAEQGHRPASDACGPGGTRSGSAILLLVPDDAPAVGHRQRSLGRRDPATRFRFDILLTGEDRWTSNHLRFTDEDAALARARGLRSRWTVIDKIRVVREDAVQGEFYVEGSAHQEGMDTGA